MVLNLNHEAMETLKETRRGCVMKSQQRGAKDDQFKNILTKMGMWQAAKGPAVRVVDGLFLVLC